MMFRFRIRDLFLITACVALEISLLNRYQIGWVFCLTLLLMGLLIVAIGTTAFFSQSKNGMLDIDSNPGTRAMLWLLRIDLVFIAINLLLVIFGAIQ